MLRIRPILSVGITLAVMGATPVLAQTSARTIPPQNAMKLSQIVAKVEQRDHFQYISEIDWSRDGYYDIIYYTTDKAKVEVKINPQTGNPE
jgi:Peptidase propeptide and YPEB domain